MAKTKPSSQKDLAKLVGITPSHMSRIWSGKRIPSMKVALKIAEVLGTTVDFLFKSGVSFIEKGEEEEEKI